MSFLGVSVVEILEPEMQWQLGPVTGKAGGERRERLNQ